MDYRDNRPPTRKGGPYCTPIWGPGSTPIYIRTAYPLLLALADADISDREWVEISSVLESYLLRRAVCNLGTKNYNRIFLSLTRAMRKDGFSAEHLKKLLLAQAGESSLWPDDVMFREAWLQKALYGPLNSPKLVHLFSRLNQTFMSDKAERVRFAEAPSVEHILPQSWVKNWPFADGSKGYEFFELSGKPDTDPRAHATRKREAALQTLGNLTILSTALNASQSNLAWGQKRLELMKHSLLPINRALQDAAAWDEANILQRGEALFDRAQNIWRHG